MSNAIGICLLAGLLWFAVISFVAGEKFAAAIFLASAVVTLLELLKD